MKPFCLLNAFVLLQSNYFIEMFQLKQKNDPQNPICISNWIFSISCRLSATLSDNDFRSFLQLLHIGFSWRFVKVWVFWEGHKIWKNIRHTFDKNVVFCARNSVLVKKSTKSFQNKCGQVVLYKLYMNNSKWELYNFMKFQAFSF